jgi:maltose alpha-D-glucosyltransferase/alpha-amylase
VPNEGDAWRFTLDNVGNYFHRVLTSRVALAELPPPPRRPVDFRAPDLPPPVQELIGPYLEAARLLGQRTAEMHTTLASARDDPAFAPEPFTALYQRSLYQSLRTRALQSLEALRKAVPDLPGPVQTEAQRVLGLEGALMGRLKAFLGRKITALRTRCHGNYHLGQLLYTGRDFVIIDFDGDVTRSISERNRKRSPLGDVSNMVRSFHYAAVLGLGKGDVRPEDVPALGPWAYFWHRWVAVAFLKAYREAAAAADYLPQDAEDFQALLEYSLLKRLFNEVRGQLAYPPERLKVPVQGLLHLLDETA